MQGQLESRIAQQTCTQCIQEWTESLEAAAGVVLCQTRRHQLRCQGRHIQQLRRCCVVRGCWRATLRQSPPKDRITWGKSCRSDDKPLTIARAGLGSILNNAHMFYKCCDLRFGERMAVSIRSCVSSPCKTTPHASALPGYRPPAVKAWCKIVQ